MPKHHFFLDTDTPEVVKRRIAESEPLDVKTIHEDPLQKGTGSTDAVAIIRPEARANGRASPRREAAEVRPDDDVQSPRLLPEKKENVGLCRLASGCDPKELEPVDAEVE